MDYKRMTDMTDAYCNLDASVHEDKTHRALAMAYVEWQDWQNIYPTDVGFERGTIFEDLDKPFIGKEAACNV